MHLWPTIQTGVLKEKTGIQKIRNFRNNRGNRQLRSKAHITCCICSEKGHYKNECYAPPNNHNNGYASGN